MSEPKIFTRNYVDRFALLSGTFTTAFMPRLYDQDRFIQYSTSGANSDATEAIIQADFYGAGVPIYRTIDSVLLNNHNFKAVTVETWNGTTWAAFGSASSLTASTTLISGTAIATQKVRVRVSTTQTANQEKMIGELIACALLLDIGKDLASYNVAGREKRSDLTLADGSMRSSVVMFSETRSQKYGAKFGWRFLSASSLNSLRIIKESASLLTWQPESSYNPDEIYQVLLTSPWAFTYASTSKGGGYNLDMEVKEA